MKQIRWSRALVHVACLCGASLSMAQPSSGNGLGVPQAWMSPDVSAAWEMGFKGAGATMIFVDDFNSRSRFNGNLGEGLKRLRHGEWTLREASLIAPEANARGQDFNSGRAVTLSSGLNVINMSYGIYGRSNGRSNFNRQEQSIIGYATNGQAVVSKAAGNDGVHLDRPNARGQVDTLNLALRDKPTVIFVGALSTNGSTQAPADLASYSNKAGTDTRLQNHFLVVGTEGSKTMLNGTSFAAPIVTGYAAIVGSKFTTATPVQITNQLLNTARTDTIRRYDPVLHGRGEASLSRALAPVGIQ